MTMNETHSVFHLLQPVTIVCYWSADGRKVWLLRMRQHHVKLLAQCILRLLSQNLLGRTKEDNLHAILYSWFISRYSNSEPFKYESVLPTATLLYCYYKVYECLLSVYVSVLTDDVWITNATRHAVVLAHILSVSCSVPVQTDLKALELTIRIFGEASE
jgi:hypothetical protein